MPISAALYHTASAARRIKMTVNDNRNAAAAAGGVSRVVIDKLAARYGEPVLPAAAIQNAFPGLPVDPDNPARREIDRMAPADAYAAGFGDRRNGAPRRSDRDLDYDLGWRDAAPGGHGWRD